MSGFFRAIGNGLSSLGNTIYRGVTGVLGRSGVIANAVGGVLDGINSIGNRINDATGGLLGRAVRSTGIGNTVLDGFQTVRGGVNSVRRGIADANRTVQNIGGRLGLDGRRRR